MLSVRTDYVLSSLQLRFAHPSGETEGHGEAVRLPTGKVYILGAIRLAVIPVVLAFSADSLKSATGKIPQPSGLRLFARGSSWSKPRGSWPIG